jgi:hypothetical protein
MLTAIGATEAVHLGAPDTLACVLRSIDDGDSAVARLVAPRTFTPGDDAIDGLRAEMSAGTRPHPERQREV